MGRLLLRLFIAACALLVSAASFSEILPTANKYNGGYGGWPSFPDLGSCISGAVGYYAEVGTNISPAGNVCDASGDCKVHFTYQYNGRTFGLDFCGSSGNVCPDNSTLQTNGTCSCGDGYTDDGNGACVPQKQQKCMGGKDATFHVVVGTVKVGSDGHVVDGSQNADKLGLSSCSGGCSYHIGSMESIAKAVGTSANILIPKDAAPGSVVDYSVDIPYVSTGETCDENSNTDNGNSSGDSSSDSGTNSGDGAPAPDGAASGSGKDGGGDGSGSGNGSGTDAGDSGTGDGSDKATGSDKTGNGNKDGDGNGKGDGDGKGNGGGGGSGSGDKKEGDCKATNTCPDTNPGPGLPGQPKLYEPKYPDGVSGVWNQSLAKFNHTPIFSLVKGLLPTNIDGGTPPCWHLDFDLGGMLNFGSHELCSDSSIWPILRSLVIVSALLLAYKLVFGGA